MIRRESQNKFSLRKTLIDEEKKKGNHTQASSPIQNKTSDNSSWNRNPTHPSHFSFKNQPV